MNNNMQQNYEFFKIIQDKLDTDEEFAKKFYECLTENIFHISKLTNIHDVKLGDKCIFNIK